MKTRTKAIAPSCPDHPGILLAFAGIDSTTNATRYFCALDGRVILVGTGMVKSFSVRNGYGFLQNGTERDIYFQACDLAVEFVPREGTLVRFRLEQFRNGKLRARDIRLL